MRPLEILIPATLAINILWPFLTGRKTSRILTAISLITSVLVFIHLWIEGYRWQMIPLYIMTGLILLAAVIEQARPGTSDFKRLSWAGTRRISALILLIILTLLPVLLPVPKVPKPNGPYQVGTQTFLLTDDSRRELYSGRDEPRKFMVQIWYPANPDTKTLHAPWMNDAPIFAREIAKFFELPFYALDHLDLVKTPSFQDAPIKSSSIGYPIIIFSHGWSGFAAQNSGQAIELASHGYVVAAIHHTYGAMVTVFPDGTIALNNPNALPSGIPEREYEIAARTLANQWAGDISFALDFLTSANKDSFNPFYSSLDTETVGVFGHSTGGGAAIQFCGTDARCKSVLGMDPFMTPVSEKVLENGIKQPAFFMFSQKWIDDVDSKNNRLFEQFYGNITPSSRSIGIQGTSHYDFSDLPMLSPITPLLGLKGPLNGKRVTEITNAYLLAFFESTLKGKPTELFDGPPPYPEVIVLH